MDDQAELVSSAITNESGQVRWTGVQAGEYNLLASRSGVYYYDQLINIEADGIKNVGLIIP
jgi:hypothetical protein